MEHRGRGTGTEHWDGAAGWQVPGRFNLHMAGPCSAHPLFPTPFPPRPATYPLAPPPSSILYRFPNHLCNPALHPSPPQRSLIWVGKEAEAGAQISVNAVRGDVVLWLDDGALGATAFVKDGVRRPCGFLQLQQVRASQGCVRVCGVGGWVVGWLGGWVGGDSSFRLHNKPLPTQNPGGVATRPNGTEPNAEKRGGERGVAG